MQIYAAAATDVQSVKRIAETYGFCLVKDVFAPRQMAAIREGIKKADATLKSGGSADAMSHTALQWVLLDPQVLDIARALVGTGPVYYGSSNINYEDAIGALTLSPYTDIHCDAIGRPLSAHAISLDQGDKPYGGYRFAIYTQDYRAASGGLKVVVGSHLGDPRLYQGKALLAKTPTQRRVGDNVLKIPEARAPLYNVPSTPGDLVVWNLRTFHGAGSRTFAADTTAVVHPLVEKRLYEESPNLFLPPPGPRNALFFDYGAPTADIDLYIKHLWVKHHPRIHGVVNMATYDMPEPRAAAKRHGIELRCDPIIVSLAYQLAELRKQLTYSRPPDGSNLTETVALSGEIASRLADALAHHREFSGYFPLIPPEIARELTSHSVGALDKAVSALLTA